MIHATLCILYAIDDGNAIKGAAQQMQIGVISFYFGFETTDKRLMADQILRYGFINFAYMCCRGFGIDAHIPVYSVESVRQNLLF